MSKIKSKKQFKEQVDAAYETMKTPALVLVPRRRSQPETLPTVKSARPCCEKQKPLLRKARVIPMAQYDPKPKTNERNTIWLQFKKGDNAPCYSARVKHNGTVSLVASR